MATIRKPIFVIPLDLGDMQCGTARDGHGVGNLARFREIGTTWRSNGNSGIWARGTFDGTRSVDFCAVIAANAQPDTRIRLRLGTSQAEVDGESAPYDSGAVVFVSPAITREDGLYHSHLELSAVQEASWWRIDITGHSGDFEAAALVMGEAFSPSRFYNYDFEYGVRDLGSLEVTRFGVLDEEPGDIWRTLSLTLAWQTEDEFETSFRPMMEKLGMRGIIYCCFDPEPTVYRQARTYLGFFNKSPFARGVRKPRTFAQDFEIISMI